MAEVTFRRHHRSSPASTFSFASTFGSSFAGVRALGRGDGARHGDQGAREAQQEVRLHATRAHQPPKTRKRATLTSTQQQPEPQYYRTSARLHKSPPQAASRPQNNGLRFRSWRPRSRGCARPSLCTLSSTACRCAFCAALAASSLCCMCPRPSPRLCVPSLCVCPVQVSGRRGGAPRVHRSAARRRLRGQARPRRGRAKGEVAASR